MGVFESAHRAVETVRHWPGVRQARQAAFERRFRTERAAHLFHGVYPSFEAAQAAAPDTAALGYDNTDAAELYLGQYRAVDTDYPAFFWLGQGLQDPACRRIVDLGGHIGIKFHALRALIDLPSDLRWQVIDVPEVARRGRSLWEPQVRDDSAKLEFHSDHEPLDGADLVFASGSLQYLPQTLAELLAPLAARPRRLVINTTPIHSTRSFFTLNSIGCAYCPYRVQNRQTFMQDLERLGYRLLDNWTHPGKGMQIPFIDGHDVAAYSGFCFVLDN